MFFDLLLNRFVFFAAPVVAAGASTQATQSFATTPTNPTIPIPATSINNGPRPGIDESVVSGTRTCAPGELDEPPDLVLLDNGDESGGDSSDEDSDECGQDFDATEAPKESTPKRPRVEQEANAAMLTFMSKFKKPEPAECARKRKLNVKKPPKGMKRSKKKQGSRVSDVKQKTLRKRPQEFPNEGLCVRGGQLHCEHCHENVGSSIRSIKVHNASEKHMKAKERSSKEKENQRLLGEAIDQALAEAAAEGVELGGFDYVSRETQVPFACIACIVLG